MAKKSSLKAWLGAVLIAGGCAAWAQPNDAPAASSSTDAVAEQNSPYGVVKGVTDRMMAVIRGGEQALKNTPEEYFADIRDVLDPHVSFAFIARNVMAGYWQQASREQKKQFVETFTQGMVQTFGKGMANYSDLKIQTLKPDQDLQNQGRVEIVQEIQGEEMHRVSYTLAKHNSGDWMLINVVLDGVNLGKSFRDQFAQAMKAHNGDMDKVIANWAASDI